MTGLIKKGTFDSLISSPKSIFGRMSGSRCHTKSNECQEHETHQASFSIMHEIPESQPFFCFSCDLALLIFLISLGEQGASVSKMIKEILDNESTFGNDNRLVRTRCGDRNNW